VRACVCAFSSVALLVAFLPDRAAAFEPMRGCFIAAAACPALASIRKGTNPGGIATVPGQDYELEGANSREATHFQILIEGAEPRQRWVEITCGQPAPSCEGPGQPPGDEEASLPDNVLAASWQPAFCELHRRTPECRSQSPSRFDASHFALHGLWPGPQENVYCGVSGLDQAIDEAGHWERLPPVRLSGGMRAELEEAMPGTRSHLDRHEWIKHGTCYRATAERYFRDSLQLLEELNADPVRELFAGRIGEQVSLGEVRTAFEEAFGAGAGDAVGMECEDGLIIELRIHLRGEIREETTLAELLSAAPPAPPGCPRGRVDEAGFGP
jgi:ribonuclease T2